MVFCNELKGNGRLPEGAVTILILIDGFLQFTFACCLCHKECSHNPYFNRWFSAIVHWVHLLTSNKDVTILILIDGFLQYDGGGWLHA